ncbi:MAG: hypothetical protein IPI67_04565 [Myxococcales bacterium]|nr:hypothetical protein [Myxococcales bacterium]
MTTLGHALLALGLLLSWTNSSLHVLLADRPLYAGSTRMFRGPVPRRRLLAVSTASLGFAGLVALFLSQVQPESAAGAILLALALIRRVEIAQWHEDIVVRLGKYLPAGACLAAWLVADLTLAVSGTPFGEARQLAWNAACGVMAGAHVLAAFTKLRLSGLAWMRADRQALLIAERAFAGPRILRALRLAVVRSRTVSLAAGVFGLVTEALAIFFIFPGARLPVLTAVIALHLGFMLLLGYFEIEWIVVLVAVVLLAA